MPCSGSRRPRLERPALPSALALLACTTLALASDAAAQTEGEPISCDYELDLVTGPVLGSGRVVGMGGAYTALATGIEGGAYSPASYAARTPWETDWFEWNGTIDLRPSVLRNTDFDNNGQAGAAYGDLLLTTLGIGLQFGELGLGAVLNVQDYDARENVGLNVLSLDVGVGYMLAGGAVVVGLGVRRVEFEMTDGSDGDSSFSAGGILPTAGALLQPAGQPWRIGVATRMPAVSDQVRECVAASLFLPTRVHSPWELQIGFAWQFGPRPLNRRWINPHDEADALRDAMLARRERRARDQLAHEAQIRRMSMSRERQPPRVAELGPDAALFAVWDDAPSDPRWWQLERVRRADEERELVARLEEIQQERERELRARSRRYLLMAAELIFVGTTENGVGIESFLSQRRQASGREITVGLRFGVEGEPIPNWLQMRAGTYLEPSRFERGTYRAHGTLGADLRLFSWDMFGWLDEFTVRAGASADVAERYLNAGFGVGLWH
jgi:hypothetical protein